MPGLSNNSSVSSCDEIVSRFRLHASFQVKASDFKPYEYVEHESQNDKICLRSSSNTKLSLQMHTKSSNLDKEVQLKGRADIRLPKYYCSGFLNVQDPYTLHSWNRRWCVLNGLHLSIYADTNYDSQESSLYTLNLQYVKNTLPVTASPRELCARPRAFCLQTLIAKSINENDTAAVFFAAETANDLEYWLNQLNQTFDFIKNWI